MGIIWSISGQRLRVEFSSTAGRNVEWTAPNDAGEVTITITVGDGKLTDSRDVSIRVEEAYKEPPGNFHGTSGDEQVGLTWENPGSNQFVRVVIRRSESDFPAHAADGDPVYSGKKEIYTDTGLVNDVTYYYAIFVEYTDGGYSDRATLSATPRSGLLPPAMPSGLRADKANADSLSLSWNAVTDAEVYELRRDGTEVYRGGHTTFTDAGLSVNTDYFYHIRAINAAGTSDWSADVRGRIDLLAPGIPAGLRVDGVSTDSLGLVWDAVTGAER